MPCISPDGRLTGSAKRLLAAAADPLTPEEIAGRGGLPLFRVRSSLRELVQAGLIEEKENKYRATENGREALQRSSSSWGDDADRSIIHIELYVMLSR